MGRSLPWRCITAAALAATLGGCAYVTAVPAPPGSNVSGIRIYDHKPLLIVNGENVTVEMVPNYNRAYALQFGAFLAKNNFEASIANGQITNVKANMDSTEFIKVLTALIEKLPAPGQGFSGPAPKTPSGGIQDRFQVYDIVFDNDGNLVGLRPLVSQADLLHVKTTRPTVIQPPAVTPQPNPGGGTITPGPI